MRTTVTLEDDVAAAVEGLRRERGVGPSRVINDLIRAGLTAGRPRRLYKHRSYRMGARMDLTNIGEVLDEIEGPYHR